MDQLLAKQVPSPNKLHDLGLVSVAGYGSGWSTLLIRTKSIRSLAEPKSIECGNEEPRDCCCWRCGGFKMDASHNASIRWLDVNSVDYFIIAPCFANIICPCVCVCSCLFLWFLITLSVRYFSVFLIVSHTLSHSLCLSLSFFLLISLALPHIFSSAGIIIIPLDLLAYSLIHSFVYWFIPSIIRSLI